MIWKVEFWRASDAMVTGESLPLRFTETGELALAQATTDVNKNTMFLTRDENRVIASQASVAGEQWVPTHWRWWRIIRRPCRLAATPAGDRIARLFRINASWPIYARPYTPCASIAGAPSKS